MSKTIGFTTVTQGNHSSISLSGVHQITSREQWEQIWAGHNEDDAWPPALPAVDFTREQILAVFGGDCPSGGYSLEVVEVKEVAWGSIEVLTKWTIPGAGATSSETTQPHHIVRLTDYSGYDPRLPGPHNPCLLYQGPDGIPTAFPPVSDKDSQN